MTSRMDLDPVSSITSRSTPSPSPPGPADAFLDLGAGPFPEANTLTSGGALPWYTSPAIQHVFGGLLEIPLVRRRPSRDVVAVGLEGTVEELSGFVKATVVISVGGGAEMNERADVIFDGDEGELLSALE